MNRPIISTGRLSGRPYLFPSKKDRVDADPGLPPERGGPVDHAIVHTRRRLRDERGPLQRREGFHQGVDCEVRREAVARADEHAQG